MTTGPAATFTLPTAWAREAPPGDRAEPRVALVEFGDLGAGLRRLGDRAAAPPWTVLLTAHLKVLSMLTPEEDVRSDVRPPPPSGPKTAGGPVLACRVARPEPTWRRAVEQVRADTETAERGEGGRSPGHPDGALFTAASSTADGAEETTGPEEPRPGHALRVVLEPDRLRLVAAARALGPDRLDSLSSMYRLVLEAMAADPDGDASAAHLPPGERRLLLEEWSRGPRVERERVTVTELIRRQAEATPGRTAVRAPGGDLGYRELETRSNQIAHHLAGLGAAPGTVAGVCLRRDRDLLPVLLGIWKTGATYLPLDPQLPAERLRQMTRTASCSVAVTDTGSRTVLAGVYEGETVVVEHAREQIATLPTVFETAAPDPERPAYIMFTSGSTGAPKGVLVHHGGLLNYLLWTVDAYASHGTGGAPVFSSISFDLGIPNLLTPLLCGQAVHLLREPLDIADLGRNLAEGGPYGFIKMTPGHLDLLTHQLTAEEARDLAGVVIAAGDTFPSSLARRWRDLAGADGTAVATEYGPTEITIGNSGALIERPPATELVPLGDPIPNSTMFVLTERLEPVPVGVPGEVYIGGAGVTYGYLGRPDLTAAAFLPDPYGPPGARLYRTGDLARWLPDGSLDFLGRADTQVKIRGHRVEPGEIQANLCRHPHVLDAVVVAAETGRGDGRLVAHVVLDRGRRLDGADLHARLTEALPDYMVPQVYVAIERIPLTTNGKVDGRALPSVL